MIGDDFGNRTAIAYAQGSHAHALVAGAYAAVAQDAARGVEVHDRAPLLFVDVQLALDEAAFTRAIAEDHVLQFALAALVTDRAIEGMIGQQELEGSLAGLLH